MGTLTNVGYLTSQPEDYIQQIKTLFETVFGISVNLQNTTIIGALIQELAEILIQVENDKTYLYSDLYNSNLSDGKWLDGLFKFDNITRLPATYSTIVAQLTGIPGTVIAAGNKAITTNNDIFILQNSVTLDNNGNGTGNFTAQNSGSVPVNANTLNRIVQSVSGWSTVNNTNTGTIGTAIETDYNFRYTQKYKLAINSSGGVQSLISNFAAQSFITYYNVYNNNTSTSYTDTITGIVIPPYSVYVALAFIDSADYSQQIGKIFYDKMTAGTPTSGQQVITYVPPLYTYSPETFYYDLGVGVEIVINIIIPIKGNYPANLNDLIINNIISIFNGQSNQEPILMGSIIYARRFERILVDLGIYNIIGLTIGSTTLSQGSAIQLGINQYPIIDSANINITRQ